MDTNYLSAVQNDLHAAVDAMGKGGHLPRGGLFVLGCSTSEVAGKPIGSASSLEIGQCIVDALLAALAPWGMALAIGCCEHLNRAVAIPRAVAQARGYEEVNVSPVVGAGGACGQAYMARLGGDGAMVERVAADAGIDIGHTLIGMHLKPVAVPLRCDVTQIGHAPVVLAYSRPKYVGGPRAQYQA